MTQRIQVTVWNEFIHEKINPEVAAIYPDGIHRTLADCLNIQEGIEARTATLDEPEDGLTEEALQSTDVLIWWGHKAHDKVSDETVKKVHKRVLEGMGFIGLHSAHYSKIFRSLLGTECSLKWRDNGERERIWVIEPSHPIAAGLGEYFELPKVEMYGERFDIPTPDKLVFISWFEGGEVFRSGCCWEKGHGKIFYFRPGHETFPIYHDANVKRVIANAVRWAAPTYWGKHECPRRDPLETIST